MTNHRSQCGIRTPSTGVLEKTLLLHRIHLTPISLAQIVAGVKFLRYVIGFPALSTMTACKSGAARLAHRPCLVKCQARHRQRLNDFELCGDFEVICSSVHSARQPECQNITFRRQSSPFFCLLNSTIASTRTACADFG